MKTVADTITINFVQPRSPEFPAVKTFAFNDEVVLETIVTDRWAREHGNALEDVQKALRALLEGDWEFYCERDASIRVFQVIGRLSLVKKLPKEPISI